jgi:N-acetyl-anhydromuramyl-L-alanine amidase AmpD
MNSRRSLVFIVASIFATAGCFHHKPMEKPLPLPATVTERTGHEIVVAGQFYHTDAPVVLWVDKGGYDMYSGPTTLPATRPSPPRRVVWRPTGLTEAEQHQVQTTGWTLPLLRKTVDQFVIHYDVDLVSNTCFHVLKQRGLGVQFMLDLDGTVYQTMDLQENAPHATKANGRSVGVEIANIGAYPNNDTLKKYYSTDENGAAVIELPEKAQSTIRTPNFLAAPARKEVVVDNIQGEMYHQYDFTPQQYESLIKLTATLCTVFPKIQADYPRQKTKLGSPTTRLSRGVNDPTTKPSALATPHEPGVLIPHTLSDDQYANYQGVLGHYHVQLDKQDPGPAFQWHGFIQSVRSLMSPQALKANELEYGHPVRSMQGPTTHPAREGRRMSRRPSSSITTKPAASKP